MKRMTERDTSKAKTGSYEEFSEKYMLEVLEHFSSNQETRAGAGGVVETRRPQDKLCITRFEVMAKLERRVYSFNCKGLLLLLKMPGLRISWRLW
jgi:hypothetical protein